MLINRKRPGVSLLEVIVYMAILLVVVTVITSFVIDIIQIKNRSRAERITYQEARYILERINSKIRRAPGIDTGNSIFDQDDGKLVLKSPEAATNLTQIWLDTETGRIYEKMGDSPEEAISSDVMNVTQLEFKQVVSSVVQSSIETIVTVEYIDVGRADLRASTSLFSNASVRNNYPYNWQQTSWENGSGQAQWSDPEKYYEDNGALDYTSCEGDVRLGTDPLEIVIHVADVCDFHGSFHQEDDSTAAEDIRAEDMPNLGLRVGGHFGNSAESHPEHYFDVSFNANKDTKYHVWARLKVVAESDWGTSDSLYMQFSDSYMDIGYTDPVNQIWGNEGLVVTHGDDTWEWNDIWTGITNRGEEFYLANNGAHTLRVQRREDGFAVDQVVISSSTYMSGSPGSGTIVPKKFAELANITSSAYDTGDASVFGQLNWDAYAPADTSVRFKIRSADSYENLSAATWYGPTSPDDYYTETGAGINSTHDGDQWVQYYVVLDTIDTEKTPTLSNVEITYSN